MPLDNKLQRKRLASDTYKDDMSADKTESPLNRLLPVIFFITLPPQNHKYRF